MATFIGLRAAKLDNDMNTSAWIKSAILHFNPEYIRIVDEKRMLIMMDDGTIYRIDEESLQVFLSAMYGENTVRGDKLDDDNTKW
jgi:hypothetical protein